MQKLDHMWKELHPSLPMDNRIALILFPISQSYCARKSRPLPWTEEAMTIGELFTITDVHIHTEGTMEPIWNLPIHFQLHFECYPVTSHVFRLRKDFVIVLKASILTILIDVRLLKYLSRVSIYPVQVLHKKVTFQDFALWGSRIPLTHPTYNLF